MSESIEKIKEIRRICGDDWVSVIYERKVRPLRTRAVTLDVPARENKTEILYTLLGVELKVGKQRITCPDLAAARFLQVFARIGSAAIAIPYDITKISVLADELESAWQRSLLLLDTTAEDGEISPSKARLRRTALVKELRGEIEKIGAGDAVPQFNQNTKQRIAKR